MKKDNPHFDISASVVRQLGEDLITDEVTALIELVKNAYDADATYVSVEVNTKAYPPKNNLFFTAENNFKVQPGYIVIEDNGIGMTAREIEGGWKTISLSYKRKMKKDGIVTPKKERTPLGDKGLGRLSTQRLGQRLEMLTVPEYLAEYGRTEDDSKVEHQVAFDWGDFTDDIKLSAVPVFWETRKQSRSGTKLLITELSNAKSWEGKTRERLIAGLAQLLFPFSEVRPFNVYLKINGEQISLDTLAASTRDVAMGRFTFEFVDDELKIEGKVRLLKLRGNNAETQRYYEKFIEKDNGQSFFAYLTSHQNKKRIPSIEYIGKDGWFVSISHLIKREALSLELENKKLASPGRFYGEIDDFALRGVGLDVLDDIFSKTAVYSEFIKNHAGIRVFRDGFGIRPFGFDGNDWLGLGASQTSGRSFYGLRPQNTIGYAVLTAKENACLKETTSREGFVDSPHSRNFYSLMEQVIQYINVDLYHTMRRGFTDYRKAKSDSDVEFAESETLFRQMRSISDKTFKLEEKLDVIEPIFMSVSQQVSDVVEKVEKTPLFSSEEENQLSPLLKNLKDTFAQVLEILSAVKEILPQAKQLESYADNLQPRIEILETQLSEFSELAGLGLTAEALSHEINTITDRLGEKSESLNQHLKNKQEIDVEIVSYVEYVQTAISALRKQLSHLAPSMRYIREKKENINLHTFFDEQIDFYADRLQKNGIHMEITDESAPFNVFMNKGKLTQIVDNLILNSTYWLAKAVAEDKKFNPKIGITLRSPYLFIEDNGYGIDPSVEISLFQPFITTKPKNEGRGLGLFIVTQLLESSGGTISLRPLRNSDGRKYIFQIDLSGVIHDK